MGPQIVMYSIIASIAIGLSLILAGFYLKKKGKDWWIFVTLLGVTGVVFNAVRLILSVELGRLFT